MRNFKNEKNKNQSTFMCNTNVFVGIMIGVLIVIPTIWLLVDQLLLLRKNKQATSMLLENSHEMVKITQCITTCIVSNNTTNNTYTYPLENKRVSSTTIIESTFDESSTNDSSVIEEYSEISDDVVDYFNEPTVIVYKPSTKYVHMSDCLWVDNSCYTITTTEDVEARKCTDCNPDIEILNQYVESDIINQNNISTMTSLNYITEAERIMLCNVVGGEYGSDWVSLYDKACVVAVVMNRYSDGGWQGCDRENSIYNILTAPGQFAYQYANTSYNYNVTESCIDAVEYYFENQSLFPHYTSFYGDGTRNYFS